MATAGKLPTKDIAPTKTFLSIGERPLPKTSRKEVIDKKNLNTIGTTFSTLPWGKLEKSYRFVLWNTIWRNISPCCLTANSIASTNMQLLFFILSLLLAKNGGFAAIFARSGSPCKLPLGWPQNSTKMSGGTRKTFKQQVSLWQTISLLWNVL